jgi:hypothetical protein
MAGNKTTKKPGRIKRGLKTLGTLYAASPANVIDMMDLADMAIKLTMKKGGSPKSTKGKSTMYTKKDNPKKSKSNIMGTKKMASGKTVKGGKSDFEKMVKDLGLTKAEIADMLGLTKVDPKTGVRRKKGGSMSSSGPAAKKMPYKKPAKATKKMASGKSVGAITQQQRMAMGKK